MRILLTARDGQLAWELRRSLACLGELVALDRRSHPLALDLSEPDSIRRAVETVCPDLIVNAAAYTAVDKAEQEREAAFAVNAVAPGLLAELATGLGAGLIHYSTDYVFPGDAEIPYRETDATGPQGVYGASKLAGEEAVAAAGAPHYIFRTAWVYGGRGQNFLRTMLRLMRERELVRVVDDQIGAPTWSRLIAEATGLAIARSLQNGRFAPGEKSGIYHLTCSGLGSWHDFAAVIRAVAPSFGLLPETAAKVEPIPARDYPTPAKRPAYSVLNNDRLAQVFGLRLPDWREGLNLCLEEMAGR
jgi:dTDP-4-dehydrorhamnose reductase